MRIGNAAADQVQLDVWGEILDGLHLTREAGLGATDAAWDIQRAVLDQLAGHRRDPDNELREIRGPRRNFVYRPGLRYWDVSLHHRRYPWRPSRSAAVGVSGSMPTTGRPVPASAVVAPLAASNTG